jgi:hypothetical protein
VQGLLPNLSQARKLQLPGPPDSRQQVQALRDVKAAKAVNQEVPQRKAVAAKNRKAVHRAGNKKLL